MDKELEKYKRIEKKITLDGWSGHKIFALFARGLDCVLCVYKW